LPDHVAMNMTFETRRSCAGTTLRTGGGRGNAGKRRAKWPGGSKCDRRHAFPDVRCLYSWLGHVYGCNAKALEATTFA
jgi:hypothetical protein